jgi:hypothetical protein
MKLRLQFVVNYVIVQNQCSLSRLLHSSPTCTLPALCILTGCLPLLETFTSYFLPILYTVMLLTSFFYEMCSCPCYTTCPLQETTTMARMTISRCISAVERESDTFDICLSQTISSIPGLTPLTVWVLIGLNENCDRPDVHIPHVHSVVSLMGDILMVQHRVAYISVVCVAYLFPPILNI